MTLTAGFSFPRPDDVIAEIERPFTLHQPALQVVPVIVDVPHAGRRYPRAFVEGSRLPLRALGLERGRITGHVQYDHTRVTDPTTGEDRSISRVRPLTGQVRFENDVPDWNLTWGALWIPYFKDTTYNPDQTRYFELRNYTVLFGEYTFGGGLSVLAELTVWDDFRIGRDVFATRDPRTLAFTERQELDPRDFLRLRVRKTF